MKLKRRIRIGSWFSIATLVLVMVMQPFTARAQASKIWMPVIIPGTENAESCKDGFVIDIDETADATDETLSEPTQVISKTYALVMGLTGDSLWGLQKVGTLSNGGTTWGSFVKNIPGTLGSKILSKTGAFFALAALVEHICNRTLTQGIPADAVGFGGNSGYIPFVEKIPANGYITYFADASIPADNMEPGELLAVVFSGVDNAGWIISSTPQVTGQKRYPMTTIESTIAELVAEKKSGSETTPTADAIDEWLQLENNETRDVAWVPDPDQECPKLPNSSFNYKARVLIATQIELQRQLHAPYNQLSFEKKQELTQFVDQASYSLPHVEIVDRYKTPRPRNGIEPHDAHYTSHPLLPDHDGYDWNIELRCWWVQSEEAYIWNFRLVGPLKHGLTSSFGSKEAFEEEAYDYIN